MLRKGFCSISGAAISAGLKGTSFSVVYRWMDQKEKLDFPKEFNYLRHLTINEVTLSGYENL